MSEEEALSKKDHWFWGSILANKGTYVQIALASIFINIFGLGSAFYLTANLIRPYPYQNPLSFHGTS